MDNVKDIFSNEAHFTVMSMCRACLHAWIATVIARTSLFGLQCPRCMEQKSFATFVPQEYIDELPIDAEPLGSNHTDA